MRAGLVERPEAWPWSGQRAYLGLEELPWLTTDWVLGRFAGGLAEARGRYRDFVLDALGGGRRPEFHRGLGAPGVLGDDDFLERVLARAERPLPPPPLDAVIAQVAAAYGLAPDLLAAASRQRARAEARGVIAYLARQSGAASLAQCAARFHRDPATLSYAVARIERKAVEDTAFDARLQGLRSSLF